MNLNRIIGIKIKAFRVERKLSQENLAGIAEIDRTYLQSIEKGDRNVSLNVLIKISNALEIPVSKILENIENEL